MIKLIYNDNSIVVCNKPSGVLSQEGCQANMVSLLKEELNCDIFPVHRLDKDTNGIMVFAKNSKAAAVLSKQITDGILKKKYITYVLGELEQPNGVFEDLLFFDRQRNKSFVVKRERKGVKKAKLKYNVLDHKDGISKVEIELVTGRTHQIRVQFASRKHPLRGDNKYGGGNGEYSLTCCCLIFNHPETNESLEFNQQ